MLKKVVSLILFFSLFFLLFTALVMFVEPPAKVASWADWSFLGLSRERWDAAHLGMGLLFIVAGFTHLALNWETFRDTLRNARGEDAVFSPPFVIGALVTILFFIGCLAGFPPAKQFVSLSRAIKSRMVEIYGEPPYAEAERSTLGEFARRMGIAEDKALALLHLRNIKATSASQTLAEIARENGVAPGGVFEALKMVMEPSGGVAAGLPKDPPPGLGRRKLSDICEEYGLDLATVINRLAASGLAAKPALTLAEVARNNNALPITVYEVLRSAQTPPTPVRVETSSDQAGATASTQTTPAPTPAAPEQPVAQPAVPQEQPQPQAQVQTPIPPAPTAQTPLAPSQQPQVAQQPVTAPAPVTPAQPQMQPQPVQPGEVSVLQPQPQPMEQLPTTPPPGLEKMMLQTYCRQYNLPLSAAVARLAKHGITAFGDMSFEELSLENKRTPTEIWRLVNGQQ